VSSEKIATSTALTASVESREADTAAREVSEVPIEQHASDALSTDSPSAANLKTILSALQSGIPVEPITVRILLGWFGYKRRGYWGVHIIRETLKAFGLTTDPDFNSVWLDAALRFRLVQTGKESDQEEVVSAEIVTAAVDPTQRLSRLQAATNKPTRVSPQQTIKEALTIMMEYDYSQLPVMTGDRYPRGAITFASIAKRLALGAKCEIVQDCMEPAHVVSGDIPLFDAINDIISHEYVLVKGSDETITGIVTTSDLSLEFRRLGEPFLLLGEIEQHVRALIQRGNFTADELRQSSDEPQPEDKISEVSDLTFGGYVRLLQNDSRWARLKINLDRVEFTNTLDRIREIRNDVMHFDPDPLAADDLRLLQNFVAFLQDLRRIVY
jgi:CBS domain-containing protein